MVAFLGAAFGVVCRTLSRLFRNVVSSPSRETFHQAAIPRQFEAEFKIDASPLRRIPRKVCGATPEWSNGFLDCVDERRLLRAGGRLGACPKRRQSRTRGNRHRHGIVLRSPRAEILASNQR